MRSLWDQGFPVSGKGECQAGTFQLLNLSEVAEHSPCGRDVPGKGEQDLPEGLPAIIALWMTGQPYSPTLPPATAGSLCFSTLAQVKKYRE